MNLLKSFLLASSVLFPLSLAHENVISGAVAGLVHIEPDDAPKAGQTVTVWFELTQKGGKVLSPSSVQLKLKVFAGGSMVKPLLTPKVGVGASGEARGKASATVRFPKAGKYTLVLEGVPKLGQNLKAFLLRFDVNAVK